MSDPIQMLKNDHENVKSMFERIKTSDASIREQLVSEIEKAIKIHSALEEEIFYPAFREAARSGEEKQMFFEAVEEHHAVDSIFPDLKTVVDEGDRFLARVKVVRELVEHHIEEEENEMFPKAQELLAARLDEIGARMVERRVELEKTWASTIGRTAQKLKSAADKVMPTAAKERHEDEGRRPR